MIANRYSLLELAQLCQERYLGVCEDLPYLSSRAGRNTAEAISTCLSYPEFGLCHDWSYWIDRAQQNFGFPPQLFTRTPRIDPFHRYLDLVNAFVWLTDHELILTDECLEIDVGIGMVSPNDWRALVIHLLGLSATVRAIRPTGHILLMAGYYAPVESLGAYLRYVQSNRLFQNEYLGGAYFPVLLGAMLANRPEVYFYLEDELSRRDLRRALRGVARLAPCYGRSDFITAVRRR